MTTIEIVADQRRPIGGDGGDRYSEASKKLRQQLRRKGYDDKAIQETDNWARGQCAQAERYNWDEPPRSKQTLAIGRDAAKLADKLESESGVDNSELVRVLRAEAADRGYRQDEWLRCGPVKMKFTDKTQNKMPPEADVLALVLCHGFKRIPACAKANKKCILRLDAEISGGDCYDAAALFASTALGQDTNAENVAENVKQYRMRTKGRLRYWGFRR
jgi:hypothetical protein